MKKLAITLLAGAGLFVGVSSASADSFVRSDIYTEGDAGLTQVRMVCNEFGRCWNDRRRRVVVREYDAPRYYGERHYYGGGPSVGIGFGPRGVGVGVNTW